MPAIYLINYDLELRELISQASQTWARTGFDIVRITRDLQSHHIHPNTHPGTMGTKATRLLASTRTFSFNPDSIIDLNLRIEDWDRREKLQLNDLPLYLSRLKYISAEFEKIMKGTITCTTN